MYLYLFTNTPLFDMQFLTAETIWDIAIFCGENIHKKKEMSRITDEILTTLEHKFRSYFLLSNTDDYNLFPKSFW